MMVQGDLGGSTEAETLARAAEEIKRELTAQALQDADQTAADLDQTHADQDQTSADADQRTSDAEQILADRDQHASDRDQAAADWEQASSPADTPASSAHRTSRLERDAATKERESTAASRAWRTAQRLLTAAERDEVADARDLTAAVRDRTAKARDDAARRRDRAAEARERHALETGNLNEAVAALRALRFSGASVRRDSEQERAAAAEDRRAAAEDRQQAAADRRHAGLDELTGIFRRGTGELALSHELNRSRRYGQSLVLAMIDVDGLKVVNDDLGHPAGDVLLHDVAAAIISAMRSYDVTVRWGGDEFLCALSDVTLEVASERIAEIRRAITTRRPETSISVGLTHLQEGDTLEMLIARADAALYRAKGDRDT